MFNCCKTLERILVAELTDYLKINNHIFSDQFGFRKERSTEDQLILIYSEVAAWFDAKLTVVVALLDFLETFDLVLNSILGKMRDF